MKISASPVGKDVYLIEVSGSLDASTAPDLDKALRDLVSQGHSRLLIDASRLGFMSSAGLRVLLSAQREARRLGGEVRLSGLSDQLRKVLEIGGLEPLFYLAVTREQALEGWDDGKA